MDAEGRLTFLRSFQSQDATLLSLNLPPNDRIERVIGMLESEAYTIASGSTQGDDKEAQKFVIGRALDELAYIVAKSRGARPPIPANGLYMFVGTANGHDICLVYEPETKITSSLYLLDTKFHVVQ